MEKTERPGKKTLISGKTHCNLTNTKELEDFIAMYGSNSRFLYSVFRQYFRDDLLAFLRRYGVETKTERGERIFPMSDDAKDIVKAFEHYLADNGVQTQTRVRVTDLLVDNGRTGIG